MDLMTVKQNLFDWFATHDTFSLNENFDELYVLASKDETPFMKAAVEKALVEYENQKVVVRVDVPYDKSLKTYPVWMLDKPLERYNQTIELTYPTIDALTKFINGYCDSIKNKEARVNPLNITEREIASLILIAHQMAETK